MDNGIFNGEVSKVISDEFGFTVEIKDEKLGITLPVDVWIVDEDVSSDWNNYIFSCNNVMEMQQANIQKENTVWIDCDAMAVDYLVRYGYIMQNDKGNWERIFTACITVSVTEINSKEILDKTLKALELGE